MALVGESGSGKSTIARLLARVYEPTSGDIRFDGKPFDAFKRRKAKLAYRGDVAMVFQDPYSSINPAYRVSHGIKRAIKLHRPELDSSAQRAEAIRVMEAVGLEPAEEMLAKYPYELSGGQRQRIGFAGALVLRPKLIIADEPVSMLDVSIRVGILNLMADLRERENVSILYITHDLASARYVADRIIVMYAGHVVEVGPTEELLAAPRHPYTELLLSAVPDPRAPLDELGSGGRRRAAEGRQPGARVPLPQRCPYAIERCSTETPALRLLGPRPSRRLPRRPGGGRTGAGIVNASRAGCSYFGVRIPRHARRDMADLAARGYRGVQHTFSENDFAYYRGTMAELVEASHAEGLFVQASPWGVGRTFGGEAESRWVAFHPEECQVLDDGRRVAAACLSSDAYRGFCKEWADWVLECGVDCIFWDEPAWVVPQQVGSRRSVSLDVSLRELRRAFRRRRSRRSERRSCRRSARR